MALSTSRLDLSHSPSHSLYSSPWNASSMITRISIEKNQSNFFAPIIKQKVLVTIKDLKKKKSRTFPCLPFLPFSWSMICYSRIQPWVILKECCVFARAALSLPSDASILRNSAEMTLLPCSLQVGQVPPIPALSFIIVYILLGSPALSLDCELLESRKYLSS